MRRYFRVSLRGALVLVSVLCIWMGYVAYQYRKELRAGELIQQNGGRPAWKNVGPGWLTGLLGQDPFSYVREVSFVGTSISDDDLAPLARLKRLEQLNIAQSTTFTGKGLRHLDGLCHLRQVYLYDVPVDDQGLQELPTLPALLKLYVLATEITDESLAVVEKHAQLSEVQLGSALLTKAAVEELDGRMPTCEVSWSDQAYSADQ